MAENATIYDRYNIQFTGTGWYGLVTISRTQQPEGYWFSDVCWKKFDAVPIAPDVDRTPNGRLELIWLTPEDVIHVR